MLHQRRHVATTELSRDDHAALCRTSYRSCPPKALPFLDTDGSLEHDDLTLPCIKHPNASSIVSTALVSTQTHRATPPLTSTLSTTMSCPDLTHATTVPPQLRDPVDAPRFPEMRPH